jgi:hypothetical protein
LYEIRFGQNKVSSNRSQDRLRTQQRREQKEIETKMAEEGKDVDADGQKLPSLYCKTCKLMFHQVPILPMPVPILRSEDYNTSIFKNSLLHVASEVRIKKFLILLQKTLLPKSLRAL